MRRLPPARARQPDLATIVVSGRECWLDRRPLPADGPLRRGGLARLPTSDERAKKISFVYTPLDNIGVVALIVVAGAQQRIAHYAQ
jgi:hypothetical protein